MRKGRVPQYRFLPGNVVEVSLTKGMVTLIDLADLPRVSPYRWSASKGSDKLWYAATRRKELGGFILLHRFLLGVPRMGRRPCVDHRNFDTLDNRRENLRSATNAESIYNQRRRSDNSSGYKGVSWSAQRGLWRARLTIDGHERHLGSFQTKEEAARAYDEAVLRLHGEFAVLNLPKLDS